LEISFYRYIQNEISNQKTSPKRFFNRRRLALLRKEGVGGSLDGILNIKYNP